MKTREKFYKEELNSDTLSLALFNERAECALNWLESYAPEDFKYKLRSKADLSSWTTPELKKAHEALCSYLSDVRVDDLEAKVISDQLYEKVIHASGVEAKDFFLATYQALICRDRGPRLPSFLKEIGQDRLLQLLRG